MAFTALCFGTIMDYILAIAVCAFFYFAVLSIYRLCFDPLSKFPGPKLAAISSWYAAYHDLYRGGQYIWEVEEMHRRYGSIVRIRPDALHVNDPSFVDKLYTQSPKQRRERYETITSIINADGSILGTRDHHLHRKRRAVLNPFFSKQNVRQLEPVINETLATLLHRMQGWADTGQPVHMNLAYRAATKDVIQAYAFGEGDMCLEMEDLNATFFSLMEPQRVHHLNTHASWVSHFMHRIPPSILVRLWPRLHVFVEYDQSLATQIDTIRKESQTTIHSHHPNRTIFHDIIQSDIPNSEKDTRRLADEARILVVAGSETTAFTLAALTYHLLANPSLLTRLKHELAAAMPNPNIPPDSNTLDALPFLNALIHETLRLHPGASHRQDRTAPDETLIFEPSSPTLPSYTIPPNTAIGMTAPLLNRHPSLYDRPTEFLPDRYLNDPKLARHLFSFSKGTRQCVGMNLAYQELQTFTAGIFRRYGVFDPKKEVQDGPTLELFRTGVEDVQIHADYISSAPRVGSRGLRVIVRN